jgi:hypothetical protein
MIISRATITASTRRQLRRLRRALAPAQGQHRADSMASADWLERTPQPPAAPALLAPPRLVARRLSVAQRVMIQYDAAERAMTERVNTALWQSQDAWAQSHA